jgi:hypothetical protein
LGVNDVAASGNRARTSGINLPGTVSLALIATPPHGAAGPVPVTSVRASSTCKPAAIAPGPDAITSSPGSGRDRPAEPDQGNVTLVVAPCTDSPAAIDPAPDAETRDGRAGFSAIVNHHCRPPPAISSTAVAAHHATAQCWVNIPVVTFTAAATTTVPAAAIPCLTPLPILAPVAPYVHRIV